MKLEEKEGKSLNSNNASPASSRPTSRANAAATPISITTPRLSSTPLAPVPPTTVRPMSQDRSTRDQKLKAK